MKASRARFIAQRQHMSEIGGYFVWCKTNKGPPLPKKMGAEFYPIFNKDSGAEFARNHLGEPTPITAEEFKLSLDELGAKYPPPGASSGA